MGMELVVVVLVVVVVVGEGGLLRAARRCKAASKGGKTCRGFELRHDANRAVEDGAAVVLAKDGRGFSTHHRVVDNKQPANQRRTAALSKDSVLAAQNDAQANVPRVFWRMPVCRAYALDFVAAGSHLYAPFLDKSTSSVPPAGGPGAGPVWRRRIEIEHGCGRKTLLWCARGAWRCRVRA